MTDQNQELQNIIESAERLGIELDEAEAIQWLTAVAAWDSQDEIVMDQKSGVYGHTVSMLDFSPEDLAYFRAIGAVIGFDDEPGVETALALSGSAAQSKIQTYPGDADFFERINIIADTRAEAGIILARIMREKAISNGSRGNLPISRMSLRFLHPAGCQTWAHLSGRRLHHVEFSRSYRGQN